ncbi:MAG: aspartate aminotransferase family protein [Spirochaetales bacterium]|nr:MAG: aspartate aminotransferase family protein [Spirochaetales bacterium]
MAAGDPRYREPFGSTLPGFTQIPVFDIEAVRRAVTHRTAALLLETIPATLGMPPSPSGFMEAASDICTKNGALLILDEVQTGLGRTGKLWGFQHYHVVPDIVVLGKGLSGGIYPISATVLRDDLADVFADDPFLHISTFGGSELGCRVASAVLATVSDPVFLAGVNERAGRIGEMLGRLKDRHGGYFKGARQLGLMIGLEFGDPRDGLLVSRAAYANGLLMVYANNDSRVVQMLPPLNVPMELLPEIESRLDRTFRMARRLKPLAGAVLGRSSRRVPAAEDTTSP